MISTHKKVNPSFVFASDGCRDGVGVGGGKPPSVRQQRHQLPDVLSLWVPVQGGVAGNVRETVPGGQYQFQPHNQN